MDKHQIDIHIGNPNYFEYGRSSRAVGFGNVCEDLTAKVSSHKVNLEWGEIQSKRHYFLLAQLLNKITPNCIT